MKLTISIATIIMLAGMAWGQTNEVLHLDVRPLNPVVGQEYRFGSDPNTHTYMGGKCWSSMLIHWSEDSGDPYMLPPNISLPNIITDDDIRELAKSGRICAVLGHCWEIDKHWVPNLDGVIGHRKCRLCDEDEYKTEEWK